MDSITPSPLAGIGVMGRRPGPGLNEANVTPNLPVLKGGEEVRLPWADPYAGQQVEKWKDQGARDSRGSKEVE